MTEAQWNDHKHISKATASSKHHVSWPSGTDILWGLRFPEVFYCLTTLSWASAHPPFCSLWFVCRLSVSGLRFMFFFGGGFYWRIQDAGDNLLERIVTRWFTQMRFKYFPQGWPCLQSCSIQGTDATWKFTWLQREQPILLPPLPPLPECEGSRHEAASLRLCPYLHMESLDDRTHMYDGSLFHTKGTGARYYYLGKCQSVW